MQHFSKRIKHLEVFDKNGKPVDYKKTQLSTWEIASQSSKKITMRFDYYAGLMDAGNSWLDDEQLYVNFINCLPYSDDSRNKPCEVHVKLPSSYVIACGLKQLDAHTLYAPNYNILVDSPMIASDRLRFVSYQTHGKTYSLCIKGEMPRTDEELVNDFARFTEKTLEIMGELPCEDYRFLYQILPYKHYHGVEHWNSTVITIGPSDELATRSRYIDFLGVSCHELFHTWNVIRLRPKEMTPYDFQQPNLHSTGFITEGITTYYGDLILKRAGVYSMEEYIDEINKLLTRHFENDGRHDYSVAASSFDLWLDGYEKGIPGRKVSIYNEGALAAMILDLRIRKKFNNERSLDDVMRQMWMKFGKDQLGYTLTDYQHFAEEVIEEDLSLYFEHFIEGHQAYEQALFPLMEAFGLIIAETQADNELERKYGFRVEEQVIISIATDSPAEAQLMLQDKVLKTQKEGEKLILSIHRYGKEKIVQLESTPQNYFSRAQVDAKKIDLSNELLLGWLA